jgi:hypothetical protein
MIKSLRAFKLFTAFLYGSVSYFLGGLVSIPFEKIRVTTLLSPRVPLIAVGVGGLLLAVSLGKSKADDIAKFAIKAIVSYLAVILVGIVIILPMKTGQEATIIINMLTILIPAIAYCTLFGILVIGFSHAYRFAIISCLIAFPIALIAATYHFQQNIPIEFDSLWLYVALGASVAVSLGLIPSE